ncbi:MAG: zinc ribbon domain-containing protein [Nostoc sp.]
MEGKIYQEVDRFFPSSKTCHVCLTQVGSLPLDIRFWTCEKCHIKHDPDINGLLISCTRRLEVAATRDKTCLRRLKSFGFALVCGGGLLCETHSRSFV